MTRDIFDRPMGRGGELTGIWWVEAKDASMPGSLPQQRIIRLNTATVRNLSNLKGPFASTPWMWRTLNYNPRWHDVRFQSGCLNAGEGAGEAKGRDRRRRPLWLGSNSEAAPARSAVCQVILWFSTGGAPRDHWSCSASDFRWKDLSFPQSLPAPTPLILCLKLASNPLPPHPELDLQVFAKLWKKA